MADGTGRSPEQTRSRSGVDVSTLIVAALASLVAALVTSKLWASGTLISTAMTPVIVSLVKEWLQRPVEKVGEVAKAPLVAVRAAPVRGVGASARRPEPPAPRRPAPIRDGGGVVADEDEGFDPLAPPGEEGSTVSPYRVYRQPRRRRTWWAVGLASGVLAFVVAAVTITLPEVVGGRSVGGTGRTTLFSHHASSVEKTPAKSSTRKQKPAAPGSTGATTPSDQPTTRTSTTDGSKTTPQSTTPTETTPTETTQSTQTQPKAKSKAAPTPTAPPPAGGG
jgi:hypothetical protein